MTTELMKRMENSPLMVMDEDCENMEMSPDYFQIGTGNGKNEPEGASGLFYAKSGITASIDAVIVAIKLGRTYYAKPWRAGVFDIPVCQSQNGIIPMPEMFNPANDDLFNPDYPEPQSPVCAEKDMKGRLVPKCMHAEWIDGEQGCSESRTLVCLNPDTSEPFFLTLRGLSLSQSPTVKADNLKSLYQYYAAVKRHKDFNQIFFHSTTLTVCQATSKKGMDGFAARFSAPVLLTDEQMERLEQHIISGVEESRKW